VKEQGLKPLRIRPLVEAKHIFSHVEWHMRGYVVLIEEPEEAAGNLLFVEARDAKERYAVPSAFSAYWNAIKESVPE
jgi:A/G-specific adenine glycosylase